METVNPAMLTRHELLAFATKKGMTHRLKIPEDSEILWFKSLLHSFQGICLAPWEELGAPGAWLSTSGRRTLFCAVPRAPLTE